MHGPHDHVHITSGWRNRSSLEFLYFGLAQGSVIGLSGGAGAKTTTPIARQETNQTAPNSLWRILDVISVTRYLLTYGTKKKKNTIIKVT